MIDFQHGERVFVQLPSQPRLQLAKILGQNQDGSVEVILKSGEKHAVPLSQIHKTF